MGTLLKEKIESLGKNKDPEYSHYAEATSTTEGYVMGTPVIAICGKIFVPTRDPNKFPLCPTCRDIAEALFLG